MTKRDLKTLARIAGVNLDARLRVVNPMLEDPDGTPQYTAWTPHLCANQAEMVARGVARQSPRNAGYSFVLVTNTWSDITLAWVDEGSSQKKGTWVRVDHKNSEHPFCEAVCAAALAWEKATKQTKTTKRKAEK